MEPSHLTFDHLAVPSTNIAVSIQHYRSQFPDCEVLYEDASWGLIKISGLKLAFVQQNEHPPHIAFKVETREELEYLSNRAGRTVKIHRDNSESFYDFDPAGNAIEVIYYPPK